MILFYTKIITTIITTRQVVQVVIILKNRIGILAKFRYYTISEIDSVIIIYFQLGSSPSSATSYKLVIST